jgi:hypothetical protein
MKDSFGPWTTAIDTGSSAQLSTFWKRRLAMLPAVSHASLVVSRRGRLLLAAAAAMTLALPTLYLLPAVARVPDAQLGNADREPAAPAAAADEGAADGQPFRATLTGGAVVTLPGKAVVELLGVGEHPSTGKQWWAPDGTPILAPYEKVETRIQPANNEAMREIAMRVIEPPGTSVHTHIRFNSSNGSGQPLDANGKALKGMSVSAGGFLPQQETCTVGIAVGTGPWKTITRQNGRGVMSIGMMHHLAFAFAPAYEQGNATVITITYSGVDGELRVTAVDAAGKDIIGKGGGAGAGSFMQVTTTFASVALKDIVEFRVQTRPYQNYEVRDISLQPGHMTVPTLVEIPPKKEAEQGD